MFFEESISISLPLERDYRHKKEILFDILSLEEFIC